MGTCAVGAGRDGVREEPACTDFSGGIRPTVSRAALPQVRNTFFFESSLERGLEACCGRCGATRVSARVSGVLELAARCPGDPASAPLGTLPGRGRQRHWALLGVRGPAFPRLPPGPAQPSPSSQLGRRVPGRVVASTAPPAGAPCPHPAPRVSGLVPPTCSLLLTSRAAGTMGWGCHSNQTGRHNPGMCAAPPAPPPFLLPAAGAAATTSAGCGTQAAGRGGRSSPGFAGSGAKAAERKGGRDGGVEVWGGGGGRRPPSSRRGRLARRARPSGSARVKAGTAPGGRGGAHLPSPPRRACGARWAPRRSCRGCSRTRWRTRTRCQVSGAPAAPGAGGGGRGDRRGPGAGPRGRRWRRAGRGAGLRSRLAGAARPRARGWASGGERRAGRQGRVR